MNSCRNMRHKITNLGRCLLPSLLAVVLLCGCAKKEKHVEIDSFETAKTYFEKVYGITDANWCKRFDLYTKSRLVVDVRNKQMLCIAPQGEIVRWAYTGYLNSSNQPVSAVKLLDDETEKRFEAWLKSNTPLKELNFDEVIRYVKVEDLYSKSIRQATGEVVSDIDKVFSVLYNALVGDPDAFLVAYVEKESVLRKLHYKDYPSTIFDKGKFTAKVKELSNLKPESYPNAYAFIQDAGVIGKRDNLQFCYWNYRQDKLYVYGGEPKSYKLSETSVDPQLGNEIKEQILSNPDKVFVMTNVEGNRELKDLDSFYRDSLICVLLQEKMLQKSSQASQKVIKPSVFKINRAKVLKYSVCSGICLLLIGLSICIVCNRRRLKGLFKRCRKVSAKCKKESRVETGPQQSDFLTKIKKNLRKNSPIDEQVAQILMLIDSECGSHLSSAWEQKIKYQNAYRTLCSKKTEADLLRYLDLIREKNNTFPVIKAVSQVVGKAKAMSDDATEQTKTLLELSDKALAKEYSDFLKKYDELSKKYEELNEYLKQQENIFKVYDHVKGLVGQTDENCQKESFDYWDRFHIILSMASAYKSICPYFGKNDMDARFDKMLSDVKTDLLTLYIARIMLNRLSESEVDGERFKETVVEGMAKDMCTQFNAGKPLEYQLDIDVPAVKARIDQCISVLDMIRRDEKMMSYCRKIWEKSGRNFSENVATNLDRGWLLGQSLQLALYFADYLKHFVQGSEDLYCINYKYVKDGAPMDIVVDFIHNNFKQSDNFSNFVYEFLEEYGASNIDVILNNFKLKLD